MYQYEGEWKDSTLFTCLTYFFICCKISYVLFDLESFFFFIVFILKSSREDTSKPCLFWEILLLLDQYSVHGYGSETFCISVVGSDCKTQGHKR